MTGKTYSIIRSNRTGQKTTETVVLSGLSWEDADSKRDRMTEDERNAHPHQSCWTRDVFIVQMEGVQR